MSRYARTWWRFSAIAFGNNVASRLDFVTYIFGKLVRMGFFLLFAIAIASGGRAIAGYTRAEVLTFFAVMNLVDVVVQLIWYRGLTDLQRLVHRGDFDLVLTKPIAPLFVAAFRMLDVMDLVTLPAAIAFLGYALAALDVVFTAADLAVAVMLFALSCILAFSVNVLFASLTFLVTEMENVWWLYRDLVYVARFPPEVFPRLVRFIFTFGFPILVIVSFPTKGLLGLLTPMMFLWAVLVTALFLALALLAWSAALRRYTSASS